MDTSDTARSGDFTSIARPRPPTDRRVFFARARPSASRGEAAAAGGDPRVHLYLCAAITGGGLVIAWSIWQLTQRPVGPQWYMLAALTMLSGAATLRLPNVPVGFSISDSFTITAALLFGPAAGTLAVALDGLVISLRLATPQMPLRRVVFNATAPSLAMWVSAQIFFLLAEGGPLAGFRGPAVHIIGPLAIFASLYFVLNTGLIAAAIALDQRVSLLTIWRRHFAGLWLTYFGGATVAALLIVLVHSQGSTPVVVMLVTPIPLILYVTFRNAIGRTEDQLDHLRHVNRMYLHTIEALAHAIDAKDQVTHGHIRRVQRSAVRLANALGIHDEPEVRAIEAASLLHDLGKLAVPEHILNKPGKLSPTEFEKMKTHAAVGADILASIDFPYPVVPIVRHHHERWDGGGYPAGLKGEEIPLGARILSVVDCFDALTSDRPYRKKLSSAEAVQLIREGSGSRYDPRVLEAFVKIQGELPAEPEIFSATDALSTIALTAQWDRVAYTATPQAHDRAVLAAFFELGGALAAGPPKDAIEQIHSVMQRLMPAACTAWFVYDPGSDALVAQYVSGQHRDAIEGLAITPGQRLTGWVAANRTSVVNSDAALDLGSLALRLTPTPQRCLSTAIHANGDLLGALTVYSTTTRPFCDDHAAIAEVLASCLVPLTRRPGGLARGTAQPRR